MPSKEKTETSSTESMKKATEAMSDLTALQTFGFNNMTSFGTAWVEALGEMGSEVVSFVADRIKEDVRTQHEILHCDDMAELQRIQARFMKKAIEQYTAETGKLLEMSHQFFPKSDKEGGGKA